MRDLTGFSSWPLFSAHASSLASGISGRPSAEGGPDFCLFLPGPAWPMPLGCDSDPAYVRMAADRLAASLLPFLPVSLLS